MDIGLDLLLRAKLTLQYFLDALQRDLAKALEVGYSQDGIVLIVIDADNSVNREVTDRLCPDADWQSIRDQGKRPVVRGVAPPWLVESLTSVIPQLRGMMSRAPETGKYPAVIIIGVVPVPLFVEAKSAVSASGE